MSDEVALTLFYVRHGESHGNIPFDFSSDLTYEKDDPPLTDLGIKQAVLLGERLSKGKLDAIYSSTLERAVATACETAKRQGDMSVNLLPDLMEAGTSADYPGLSEKALRQKYPLAVPCTSEPTPTGGMLTLGDETTQTRELRAKRIIDFLTEKYNNGETVALFSHGTFFRYFISAALKIAVRDSLRFSCFNTGITKIKFYTDKSAKLSFSNDTSHLVKLKNDLVYTI